MDFSPEQKEEDVIPTAQTAGTDAPAKQSPGSELEFCTAKTHFSQDVDDNDVGQSSPFRTQSTDHEDNSLLSEQDEPPDEYHTPCPSPSKQTDSVDLEGALELLDLPSLAEEDSQTVAAPSKVSPEGRKDEDAEDMDVDDNAEGVYQWGICNLMGRLNGLSQTSNGSQNSTGASQELPAVLEDPLKKRAPWTRHSVTANHIRKQIKVSVQPPRAAIGIAKDGSSNLPRKKRRKKSAVERKMRNPEYAEHIDKMKNNFQLVFPTERHKRVKNRKKKEKERERKMEKYGTCELSVSPEELHFSTVNIITATEVSTEPETDPNTGSIALVRDKSVEDISQSLAGVEQPVIHSAELTELPVTESAEIADDPSLPLDDPFEMWRVKRGTVSFADLMRLFWFFSKNGENSC